MPRTRPETRARARALQALYAWDVRGEPALVPVANQIWDDIGVIGELRVVAARLVRVLQEQQAAIDALLQEVTTNWQLDRLAVIDRSLLRLAAAELSIGETPPRVVIQETVWLAERFSGLQSARFVNGVVDAVARRMGRM